MTRTTPMVWVYGVSGEERAELEQGEGGGEAGALRQAGATEVE